MRNLDKYPIGGRELRVDFSHVDSKGDTQDAGPPSNYQPHPQQPHPPGGANGMPPQPPPGHGPGNSAGVGPLPQGVELPANLSAPDAISKTLATLPPPQLLDILSQMKTLVMTDPTHATALLRQAPQLSYAIFQALLLLGLVDSSLIATVVEQSAGGGGGGGGGQQQQPQQAMNMPSRSFPPHQGPPPAAYGAQMYGAQGAVPTPPMPPGQQPGYPPPVPVPPPPQQQQQPPPMPPGQEEMIKQLLQLSPADIDRLPPNERQQIMALRQQYGGLAY